MTQASGGPGSWRIEHPAAVGALPTLLNRLGASGDAVALGVDFPLGLPRAYVSRYCASHGALAGSAADFPAFLRALSAQPQFFEVCDSLAELALERPFYPRRGEAGMTRLSHAAALGMTHVADLSRLCDRATAERPAGAPLFWTLGANQSGKAAISAWRDMLLPAMAAHPAPLLWPFDGPLLTLLQPGRVVVAETYPAEALRQLGLRLAGSKRRQSDRAALGPEITALLAMLGAAASPTLTEAIAAGFAAAAYGEDQFDSLIGVLCVMFVLSGHRPDTAPPDPWVQRWEGWVLGQTAIPHGVTASVLE